jgi:uncharacterized protein
MSTSSTHEQLFNHESEASENTGFRHGLDVLRAPGEALVIPLSLSLGAWLAGPLIDRQLGDRVVLERGLDAFARLVVGGIVLLHVLPHSLAVGGWRILAVFVVAAAAPLALERWAPEQARWTSGVGLALLGGLLVHAFIDGVALGGPAGEEGLWLALGVILHSAPLGLFVWRSVKKRVGQGAAVLALASASAATVLGFVGARLTPIRDDQFGVAVFEALVGGVLLHVLSHGERSETAEERAAVRIGAVLAIAVVGVLLFLHPIPVP